MDFNFYMTSDLGFYSLIVMFIYMLVVSIIKLVFDSNNKTGQTAKLANYVFLAFMILIVLYCFAFSKSQLYSFLAFIFISASRYWYTIVLKYVEKAYMWIVYVFWEFLKSIWGFIKGFFDLLFKGEIFKK